MNEKERIKKIEKDFEVEIHKSRRGHYYQYYKDNRLIISKEFHDLDKMVTDLRFELLAKVFPRKLHDEE
tara:strand:- start:52 stop:258 length:207 start_codon:yes stop_codon:yes gene_type:complete